MEIGNNMENLVKLIEIIVTVFIAFITAYITVNNDRKKQTTEYFKEEGIKEQKELLNFWSSTFLNTPDNAIKKYKETLELKYC